MKIAIRAEGSTDIGVPAYDGTLIKGPMLILLEKLECYLKFLNKLGFDKGLNIDNYIEWEYIHKDDIKASSKSRRIQVFRSKKEMGLEVKGFYKNSEAFSCIAKEKEADIAIFFVDADKELFEDRYTQVKAGLYKNEYNETGVPMIPVKISEAWLMCCLNQYQNCAQHENATTDKTSPLYPKNICNEGDLSTYIIAENCDPNRIDMPSFNRFRDDFAGAVNSYMGHVICE